MSYQLSNKEILMSPVLRWGGQITNWSAAAGLSSPMSGIKNIHLAVNQIYGNTNLKSTISIPRRVNKT